MHAQRCFGNPGHRLVYATMAVRSGVHVIPPPDEPKAAGKHEKCAKEESFGSEEGKAGGSL